MPARLLILLAILAFIVSCAAGSYETPSAEDETAPKMFTNPYKNAETEEEYQRRIYWENWETEHPHMIPMWP